MLKREIIPFLYEFSMSAIPEISEALAFSCKCIQFGASLLCFVVNITKFFTFSIFVVEILLLYYYSIIQGEYKLVEQKEWFMMCSSTAKHESTNNYTIAKLT